MRIYSMTATFGKLEHETLVLQPGLNVIHAPNEWGKSTWCAFLTAMLYGIETRVHTTKTSLADKERYVPWSGSPMAGRIDLDWNGRDITIERWSKGRTVFGQFRAYETATGLEVSELTSANCGQLLLGVEKSVFLRSGFLRLSDLPVTEDDALRRRLNALVTTGDESGTADALSQKLRELKNRCRANRSTGLLPTLEAQREELEAKLRQLRELQPQSERLREQEAQLEEICAQLRNHSDALAYAASRGYTDKLLAAKNAQTAAQARCRELETLCAGDPESGELERRLRQAQQLRQHREVLDFDAQLLQAPPQTVPAPEPFRSLSEAEARKQAKTDTERLKKASAAAKKWNLLLLGVILVLAGAAALLFQDWIGVALCAAGVLGGVVCIGAQLAARKQANREIAALRDKYGDILPEDWVDAAQYWAEKQSNCTRQQQVYLQRLEELQQRRKTLSEQILSLTEGRSLTDCERLWQEARERQKTLLDARRELHRVSELVQTLQTTHRETAPPARPDALTYTEAETVRLLQEHTAQLRQLKEQQGHLQGCMESLGREADLQRQLETVRERIARTEDMLAALEIAQDALGRASTELQRRFAPRIAQRARDLFRELTGGRYDRLTLDADLSVYAMAETETTARSALWRSDGTIDQLYLALRLAVARELTPEAPLVLDDALVRFDDERLVRAMSVLRREAESKQILLFTCQSREAKTLETMQTETSEEGDKS